VFATFILSYVTGVAEAAGSAASFIRLINEARRDFPRQPDVVDVKALGRFTPGAASLEVAFVLGEVQLARARAVLPGDSFDYRGFVARASDALAEPLSTLASKRPHDVASLDVPWLQA
jgi:hypothetical protein